MTEAALFDMDGLLLDSERFSLQAYEATITDFQLGHLDEVLLRRTFDQLVGVNQQAHLRVLDSAFGRHARATRFHQRWMERYHHSVAYGAVPVKAGAHELLQWFASQGIRCAVATSTQTGAAVDKLTAAGLMDYFCTVTGGDQVQQSKPAPDIYLHAGRSVDADMHRSFGFEDSPNGVRAAVAAGLDVIQIPDLIEPTAELRALGHRIHRSLLEVRDLLEAGRFQPRQQAGS